MPEMTTRTRRALKRARRDTAAFERIVAVFGQMPLAIHEQIVGAFTDALKRGAKFPAEELQLDDERWRALRAAIGGVGEQVEDRYVARWTTTMPDGREVASSMAIPVSDDSASKECLIQTAGYGSRLLTAL